MFVAFYTLLASSGTIEIVENLLEDVKFRNGLPEVLTWVVNELARIFRMNQKK